MAHIFVSYSKKNIDFARHLRHLLQDRGFTVWMDETKLVPSEKWWPTIERNIISCAAFIVIMSEEARKSRWVEREILVAENHEKPIFPVLLSGKPWSRLGEIQYADMRAGLEADLPLELYEALKRIAPVFAGEPAPPPLPVETAPTEAVAERVVDTPLRIVHSTVIRGGLFIVSVIFAAMIFMMLVTTINPPSTPTPTETTGLIGQVATNTPTHTTEPSSTPIATPTPDPLQFASTPVARNADWKPYERDFDGVTMVLVPKGCFIMGSNEYDREKPPHEQCIDEPFWIDKTEVTNAQFAHLGGVAGEDSKWMEDNRPRENITWFEAREFCDKRGGRLPTEAEWEYAARGPNNLIYPWGNDFWADNVVYGGNSGNQTAEVGRHLAGASWVGALDMSGNVWEWVSSLYKPYPYYGTHESNEDTNTPRVLRGGSWGGSTNTLRAAYRVDDGFPIGWSYIVGFRCARDFE